jgi:AcrR family transcriptional regulator
MERPALRADAARNRERILDVARNVLASSADVSMAEIARRAEVGMATLYRNFPGRRELLEGIYAGDVDALCAEAETVRGATAADRLLSWLTAFLRFVEGKREIAAELLEHVERDDLVFTGSRARVMRAGVPLLEAAQAEGRIRRDLDMDQVLDLVHAIAGIRGPAHRIDPIRRVVFDALRSEGDLVGADGEG